jgi:hypothetical protein
MFILLAVDANAVSIVVETAGPPLALLICVPSPIYIIGLAFIEVVTVLSE